MEKDRQTEVAKSSAMIYWAKCERYKYFAIDTTSPFKKEDKYFSTLLSRAGLPKAPS